MFTPSSLSPKLVAPGEGKTVELFRVRFDYKVESADSGGSLAVLEIEGVALGLTNDTWPEICGLPVIVSGTLLAVWAESTLPMCSLPGVPRIVTLPFMLILLLLATP